MRIVHIYFSSPLSFDISSKQRYYINKFNEKGVFMVINAFNGVYFAVLGVFAALTIGLSLILKNRSEIKLLLF